MNKHIELVKKWLENNESVSLEELEANKKAACDAAYAACDAAYDAAADAACNAAYYAAAEYYAYAEYWVNRYEEITK
jgi:hypothetical protein